jgi:hypothetical protein
MNFIFAKVPFLCQQNPLVIGLIDVKFSPNVDVDE